MTNDSTLSTIHRQQSMGRTESIVVERIGRVEPFWNRAKHVVVYGRSLCGSRQFCFQQEPYPGYPTLHKKEEYVEVFERERSANAFVAQDGTTNLVAGCRLESPLRIFVDGNWGNSVSGSGWQVPLWKQNALPSDVYPRPEIVTYFKKRDGAVWTHCQSDPELLCFYTNTDPKASGDSDAWPPMRGFSCDEATPIRAVGLPRIWQPGDRHVSDQLEFLTIDGLSVNFPHFDLRGISPKWDQVAKLTFMRRSILVNIGDHNVRMSHGSEPTSRSAWIQMDLLADEPIEFINFPEFSLRLQNARLEFRRHISDVAELAPPSAVSSAISGDWEVRFRDSLIVAFRQSRLELKCQPGNSSWGGSPEFMKLRALLSFLDGLVA